MKDQEKMQNDREKLRMPPPLFSPLISGMKEREKKRKEEEGNGPKYGQPNPPFAQQFKLERTVPSKVKRAKQRQRHAEIKPRVFFFLLRCSFRVRFKPTKREPFAAKRPEKY